MHEIISNSILLKEFYNSLSDIDKGLIEYAIQQSENKWQQCPKCNGTGKMLADGFTSSIYNPCNVCNGQMIISCKNGLPPVFYNVNYNNSTDNLKEGDWITCKRTVGHTKTHNCLTEGQRYQIQNLWRTEEGKIDRLFVIDNKGKKKGYDVKHNFHKNWSVN